MNVIVILLILSLFAFVRAQFSVSHYAYQYAKANRFQPSTLVPFEETKSVTTHPACFQKENQVLKFRSMSEDCLYIDIWAPELAKVEKLPVVFWIHGGAFETGATSFYNGSHLANDGSVIVVSAQYRLGFFGFNAFESYKSSQGVGNVGILDLISALQWTKKNIGHFGGDPNLVTIIGQSAGAITVNMLQAVVKDEVLFHRAISMSGTYNAPVEHSLSEAQNIAQQIISRLGCSDSDIKKVAYCLENLKPEQIVKGVQSTSTAFSFLPVVDGVLLKKPIHEYFQESDFLKIPTIVGSTKDELNREICQSSLSYSQFYATLLTLFTQAQADEIITQYNITSTEKEYNAELGRVMNDYFVHCATRKQAMQLSKKETFTFFYTFGHRLESTSECVGAYHGSDLIFLFPDYLRDSSNSTYTLSDDEKTLSDNIIQFFSNFAYSGNTNSRFQMKMANVGRRPLQCFFWNPYDLETDLDMYFDVWGLIDRRKHFYEDVCAFWDKVGVKQNLPLRNL